MRAAGEFLTQRLQLAYRLVSPAQPIGQGRAAETFGPDLLKVDKFIRTLGFYGQAEASVGALSPGNSISVIGP